MATAISYRHGTSAQHKDFRGAPSEITVSTDELTLYVHSGEESLPGVPLARADFNNVEASTIKSKGILDNKLTNFMGGNYTNIVNDKNPELGARIANYLDLIHQLGIKHTEDNVEVDNYALTNLNNVTTTEYLANRKTNPNNSKDKSLAYADLTNVDSSILTKESGSFKLATLNLDNINSDGENKILDTVKNGNLGYATEDYVNSYVDSHTPSVVGFEKLSNKVQKIDSNASDIDLANNYPSIAALLTYLSNDLNADYANVNLSNVTDWEYATYINQSNKLVINCTNPGSGYVGDTSIINTNITVLKGDIDPVETNLTIYVKEVDENGGILSFDIDPIYTQTSILSSSPISYTDNVGKASFTIYTNELDTPGKLAKADLSNTDALSKTEANSTYLKKSNAQSTYATITNLNNHTGNTNNPHNVTKAQVGLGNVNNTSDADKPVSTAQAAALDALESNLQLQITSNDTDISNLQNSKADKATDFKTPITNTNKGATMKEIEEVQTTSIRFKGYVSTTQPASDVYLLVDGNMWINAATMPSTFPVSASSIHVWDGSAWQTATESYTPDALDAWSNLDNNEGYYWFGAWKVFSTDLSTEYFTLNQTSGLWEIKQSIYLPGTPTVDTPDGTNPQAIVNVDYVNTQTLGNVAKLDAPNKFTSINNSFANQILIRQDNGFAPVNIGYNSDGTQFSIHSVFSDGWGASVGVDADGTYCSMPTPDSNGDNIANTAWVRDLINSIMGGMDFPVYWDSADSTDHSHAKPGVSTPTDHGWYRYYKSGWVEQGGRQNNTSAPNGTFDTVYLYIPMKDKNYSFSGCFDIDHADTNADAVFGIRRCRYSENDTPEKAIVATSYSAGGTSGATGHYFNWEVKGWAA